MSDPAEDLNSGLHVYDKVIAAFIDHHVDFMLVGGYAVIYHGYVRATEDLDLFIRPTEDNAKKAVAALKALSEGELDYSPDVFTKGKGVSLGERPVRIDILSQIDGITYEQASKNTKPDAFGPATVHFISQDDLLVNKRAAGRPRDRNDVLELEAGRDKKNEQERLPEKGKDPGGGFER